MSADPTADADGTYTPDDQDGHEAVVEQYEEDKAEREAQWQESLSKKERLQRARESQTITATLFGEDVEFSRLGGDTIEWLDDLGQKFRGTGDEDELTDEQFEEYRRARSRTQEILADLARDPELDSDFWADFEPEFRQSLLIELREQQAEETEQNVSFRS